MSNNFIQPSFNGGEVSPRLDGRVDLDKYHSGLGVARNFMVDIRGGVSTRPGLQFNGLAPDQATCPVLIPFIFSASQTYDLLLGDGYMCVFRDDGFVTETAVAASVGVASDPVSVTIPGAGYAVGDNIIFSDVVGFDRTNGVNGLEGRQVVVKTKATDTYTFTDVFGVDIDASTWTAFVSGNANRVYKISAPWDAEVLFELVYAQTNDIVTVTHKDYPEYEIRRSGETDWAIVQKVYGSAMSAPTGLAAAAVNNPGTSDPQFYYVYGVTASDPDTGEESVPAYVAVVNAALNQNTGVANQLAWDPVAGNNYRIYTAERAPQGSENTDGPWFMSYIGTAKSPPWSDTNIAPETSIVPPTNTNPFQSGSFSSVDITNAGFGYIDPQVTIVDAKGAGASISLTKSSAGAITAAAVLTAGDDYQAPVLTVVENDATLGTSLALAFSGSWVAFGAGFVPADGSITIATPGTHYHVPYFTLTPSGGSGTENPGFGYIECVNGVPTTVRIVQQPFVTSTSGVSLSIVVDDTLPGQVFPASLAGLRPVLSAQTNPGVNTYFEQRHVVAATRARPAGFWMTRPGLYGNFDKSTPSQANDAIDGDIVSTEVNEIASLTPMASGLIALTRRGAFQLSGGSPGAALTPTSITAQAQAFSGASSLRPLRINAQLIYEADRGWSVRDLTYNFYTNIYTGDDISALAEHLFRGRRMVQWAWAEAPAKTIWGVRDDGLLLACAYMKDEKVFGWTRHDTHGAFKSVSVTPGSSEDRARFIVRRPLANGQWGYFIERMATRYFGENYAANIPANPEAAWCVDCGAAYEPQSGPSDAILSLVQVEPAGQIDDPVVVEGGSGYRDSSFVQVLDEAAPGGTGAQVSVTTSGGAITAVTVVARGSGYVAPYLVLGDGEGAVVAVGTRSRVVFQVDTPVLDSGYEGWVLRAIGGSGTVVDVVSSTVFEVETIQPFVGWMPNAPSGEYFMEPQAAGAWTLTEPKLVFGGLDHLEGKTVAILADGAVAEPQVVVDGAVTLDVAASWVIVGLGYTCQGRTLRMDLGNLGNTIQGKRVSLSALTLRIADAAGLAVGPSFDDLVEVKTEIPGFGLPISLGNSAPGILPGPYSGGVSAPDPFYFYDYPISIGGGWTREGVVCFQQSYPRPATILAVIPEYNVGDTPG